MFSASSKSFFGSESLAVEASSFMMDIGGLVVVLSVFMRKRV